MKITTNLWARKTKDGRQFLTGPGLFGMQIFINKIENKKSENGPDYVLTMEEPREKKDPKETGGNFDGGSGW